MTQFNEKNIRQSAEFAALFLKLDETKQDSALHILKALEFSQSILCDHSQKISGQYSSY